MCVCVCVSLELTLITVDTADTSFLSDSFCLGTQSLDRKDTHIFFHREEVRCKGKDDVARGIEGEAGDKDTEAILF